MEWLGYIFIVFASISLTSFVLWYWPIVSGARRAGVVNSFTQRPILSAIIYCVVTMFLAVFIVPALLSQKYEDKFIAGLTTEIFKPD